MGGCGGTWLSAGKFETVGGCMGISGEDWGSDFHFGWGLRRLKDR